MSMIKLAEKSNPDAIPAIEKMKKSTLQNDKSEIDEKKVRDPKTVKPKQFKTKKVAKDDMELAKARKKEIRENLEKNLPKRSKDDLDLLLIEKKLRKMDIKKLKSNEIFQCAKDLKNTLETGNPLLEPLETIISMANTIDKTVDINSLLNITNKLMNVIK